MEFYQDETSAANKSRPILDITRIKLTREEYRCWIASQADPNLGDWAEFGVYKGESANQLISYLPIGNKFYLFDSWQGLPEDWTDNAKAGKFAVTDAEIPSFENPLVRLVRGQYADVLPKWTSERFAPFGFVHFDCCLYSSTKIVLDYINKLIVPGTILLFDEIYGYAGWEQHEWRAYTEWKNENHRVCEPMNRCIQQIAFKVSV